MEAGSAGKSSLAPGSPRMIGHKPVTPNASRRANHKSVTCGPGAGPVQTPVEASSKLDESVACCRRMDAALSCVTIRPSKCLTAFS
jgi:hypothetical protein